MKRSDLIFPRPADLQATAPAVARGIERDELRLMVSTARGTLHACFRDLPQFLRPGDVVVVNQSATLPASLPALGDLGLFILNLSTRFGRGLWVAEPRWSSSRQGPLPIEPGDRARVAGLDARFVTPYPGLPRLWFVQFTGDVDAAMAQHGQPIHYGYVSEAYPLDAYQTVFARVPGSAEMPSAAYPFTRRVVSALEARGIRIAPLVLHTGVSSLEVEVEQVEDHPMYPEPFEVPAATAQAVNRARRSGQRVIAVGTTVVRALESAWDGTQVRAKRGLTRLYIHPKRGLHTVDGLITGLHDPVTSHLAMLYTLANRDRIHAAYADAVREGYLWHEFGDSHLILADEHHVWEHVHPLLAAS